MVDQLPNLTGDGGRGVEALPVIVVSGVHDALVLLDDADETGDGAAWPGGGGVLFVNGTWGGATVSLQWSDDGTTWWGLGSDHALTADGLVHFMLPAGEIRAAVASAGTTTLTAVAKHV
jgi:hypothetical protein